MIPNTKRGIGKHGKVKRTEETENKLLGRIIMTRVIECQNGLQRSTCFFVDKNPAHLRRINSELRKRIQELEEKTKSK